MYGASTSSVMYAANSTLTGLVHLPRGMSFHIAVAIDRNNSALIRVIDREMISQSVLPTHHASIFPAKSTRVVKMAARIEAGAFFSKCEKWNKTLENFISSH